MRISSLMRPPVAAEGAGASATASGHAGEILQGAFRRPDGIHRFLCSLPAPTLTSAATVIPTPGRPLSIRPAWAWKSLAAARLLLESIGAGPAEIQIRLVSNVPVAKGCGSSTADVAATLRALRSHLGVPLDDAVIARLAVQAEQASDGSVLPFPAIFRHREGLIEEALPGELPAMHVIVVDTQPDVAAPTLSLRRARYSDRQLDLFEGLRERLRRAFNEADPAGVGEVATASARLNQEHLPKPRLEEIIALVESERGYGVAAAHSGTVLSLLSPASLSRERRTRTAARLAELGTPLLTEFTHPGTPSPEIW